LRIVFALAGGASDRSKGGMLSADYEAIVVGAGPAGATAAILLAEAGWKVALLEKQRFPRRKVCGECVAASNLSLLDALGVGGAFGRLAGPELHQVGLLCGTQALWAPLPRRTLGPHRWGRALGREHLDSLLLARAREVGATVLQPCTAFALQERPEEALCEVVVPGGERGALRERAVLRASIVIDAHGSWQPLRAQRDGGRRPLSGGDLLAFKANFTHTGLQDGVLPVLCFRGGYGGMVVAEDATTTVACCIRAGLLEVCRRRLGGRAAGETVEAYLKDQCAAVREVLSGARRVGPWLAAGPIRPGIRLPRGEAIFAIGNAAGEVHPIIGEGISMAIQSAWLLCARLRHDRAVLGRGAGARERKRTLQQQYAAQWRAQFGRRLRLARCFAGTAMRPVVGRSVLALLQRSPEWLTRAAHWSGKIQCAVNA
jgi:menaquinone-9 beta-reductase